ncbi:phosphoserine aminotransferase apoenzyme [Myroides guanonis]|uniref:Phosphoserine aminotransferase n=2 Tax=Myroides guanonis TaxID=1150112 RepID=A0A1I3THM2_9FLAO|nr:phosphoserine aminotransferase apoenzyme [Myroides guanonis]
MHNFSAGPCVLPREVYQQAAQAVLDYQGSGLSILEISHRSDDFLSILAEARSLALDLLHLDKSKYKTLFMQGSASLEFLRVPYNLLKTEAGYIDTGVWSSKAIAQAELFGKVRLMGSSKITQYRTIPELVLENSSLDYLHFTSNNTIYGTQFNEVPKVNVPLVCDMSSDIYSRTFDYSKIDLIYAGVQKNIGPAGLSMVLVNESILGKTNRVIPNILDYNEHLKTDNLYHTANVFGVYSCLLNLRWLQNQGGVEAIEKRNESKAKLLYETLDTLDFVETYSDMNCRSNMNVVFHFNNKSIDAMFDDLCKEASVVNLKGHRTLGGYRASLYNALDIESVHVLIEVLNQLEKQV